MSTASTHSAENRQKATIVREYGPFPVERVHGLTHDGTHVWFAHGKKLAAMNPDTGALEKELEVPAEAPKEGIPYKFIVASEPFPEENGSRGGVP